MGRGQTTARSGVPRATDNRVAVPVSRDRPGLRLQVHLQPTGNDRRYAKKGARSASEPSLGRQSRVATNGSRAGDSAGGRRRGESNAPSTDCERSAVRNAPTAESNGRSRRRGMVNGETLSARAAAARTCATLVEEVNAVQTSKELEFLAKLARLFPARRAIRTNANANTRGASAGRQHRANTNTQPARLQFSVQRDFSRPRRMDKEGH